MKSCNERHPFGEMQKITGGACAQSDSTHNEYDVERSVHEVIGTGSLQIVYQPIVDHSQNRIYGHEALSRPWSNGKYIRPDIWFRAAYQCGRSVDADLLALSTAVTKVETFSDPHLVMPLFVNVMPSSLAQSTFLEGMESLFDSGVCRPEQIVVEIIEYVSYDPLYLSNVMGALRSLGVRTALDDFGVNASSLGALVELELDFIKVDRSLIHGIADSSSKQRLLAHLVDYMDGGKSVIAEGVERHEDLLAVQDAGVSLSQGYYWDTPIPLHDLPSVRTLKQLDRSVQRVDDDGGA